MKGCNKQMPDILTFEKKLSIPYKEIMDPTTAIS